MAQKIFMKIDTIAGESTDQRHRDEIDVIAWNWSFMHTNSGTGGGGGGGGRPVVSGITFTHKIDKTSPVLMKSCMLGTHLAEAKLSVRADSNTSFDHYLLLVKDVLISSVVQTEKEDLSCTLESVTLVFNTVTEEYTPTKQDGSAGPKVTATYDIKNNR